MPVYAQHHEFSLARYGLSCREFYQDPELMVQCQLATCAEYGMDYLTVDWDCYNIEAEAMGQVIIFDEHNMPDVARGAGGLDAAVPHDDCGFSTFGMTPRRQGTRHLPKSVYAWRAPLLSTSWGV